MICGFCCCRCCGGGGGGVVESFDVGSCEGA